MGRSTSRMMRGVSLLETLVATALVVMVIMLAYQTYSDISATASQTASAAIALERGRILENEMRYYLQHAGLGVPAGAPVIVEAKHNSVSLMLNSGFFSYVADEDLFLPIMGSTSVSVQSTVRLKDGFYDREEVPLTILSDDKVTLIAYADVPPVLPKPEEENSGRVTVVTKETSYWLRKGQYLGEAAQRHKFILENRELRAVITHADATTSGRIIGTGVDAFDMAFYYKPTYFSQTQQPVWCADAAEDMDQECRYRPGNFEEPGSFCDKGDADWDTCIPCAGTINRQLDTDGNGDIDLLDDVDKDGEIDGTEISEVADFRKARLLRFWMLVAGDQYFAEKQEQTYVIGRRVLSFNDRRKRHVVVIDVDIRNL